MAAIGGDARIRPATRENMFSLLAYDRNPSTAAVAKAQPTKKAPVAFDPRTERPAGGEITRPQTSSLYLFDPAGPVTGPDATPRSIARRYHNDESESHREWPKTAVKHVDPIKHVERHPGVKLLGDTRNKVTSVAVVGPALSAVPSAAGTPRTGIRTYFRDGGANNAEGCRDREAGMKSVLDLHQAPPASMKRVKPNNAVTPVERLQATLSDHVQRRSGGAASFFVALCRGLVAPHAAQSSELVLPQAVAPPADMFLEIPKKPLTLELLRTQLVALTGIEVTLRDLASLLWNMDGVDESCPTEVLEQLEVTFPVFAAAFATAPATQKMSSFKI